MPQGFVSFREVKSAVSLESVLCRYELFAALKEKGPNLVGRCPFCESPSAQQFQVSLSKNAWHCFGCKAGGNVLDFVAKREKVSVRKAALLLDEWFALGLRAEAAPTPRAALPPVPQLRAASVPAVLSAPAASATNPPLTFTLKTLDPTHPALAPLSLKPERLQTLGAGYAAKGLMRGRLAIPVHTGEGALVAYIGLALDEATSPRYLFPPQFAPSLEVLNLHRVMALEEPPPTLYLSAEPLGVLRLLEAGFDAALGLFDGSLSGAQERTIATAAKRFKRLVLLGAFPAETIANLARHIDLRSETPTSYERELVAEAV